MSCVEPDDPDVREPDAIMGGDPAAGEDGSDASSATSANAGNDSSSEGRATEPVGGEVAMPLPIDDAGNDSGLEGPAPAAEPVGEVAIAMVLPPPPGTMMLPWHVRVSPQSTITGGVISSLPSS